MKILFIISNLTFGGIQTQAMNIAAFFQKKGFEVHFLGFKKYDEQFVKALLEKNYTVDYWPYFGKPIGSIFQRFFRLTKLIWKVRQLKPTVLVPFHYKTCIEFGAISKWVGAKVCFFQIRRTLKKDSINTISTLEHRAYKNKPILVTNSKHAQVVFQEKVNPYGLTVHQIYNGLNLRPIDQSKNWKQHFNLESYDFVAVSLANFFIEKDYTTLLKAWQLFLTKTKANAVLCIGGIDGSNGNHLQRKDYENLVKELSIQNHVRFLGAVTQNLELITASNLGILSSTSEGLPNVVLEIMGVKRCFIGTKISGIQEAVGEGYPIPLFEVGDTQHLAILIEAVYDKKFDLSQINKYTEDRINSFFNLDRLGEDYYQLITQKQLSNRAI